MSETNPVSPKVVAASAGAGLGAVLSGAILWGVGAGFFGAGWSAENASAAIAAVPTPLNGLIVGVIAVITAGVPGYRTNDPLRRVPAEDQELEEAPPRVPDWDDTAPH